MKPELIAPAGNMDCARAAVANGANAVYFGLQQFNARMRADNFTAEQLPELVGFLHEHDVRAFCAFNTLVFTDELPAAEEQLRLLDEAGVDAVIVQDLGLAVLAQQLGVRLAIHASTQMTITSPEGVAFAARLGIQRIVLARETSLRELAKFPVVSCGSGFQPQPVGVANPSHVGLEVFVHGALCIAYSGQCLTSEALGQRSANRGECAQACRLPYELVVDGVLRDLGDRRYLLSPQDLAAVHEIPELIQLGVAGFKIEGRLKSPEYVAATCQVYRKAIDACCSGASAKRHDDELRFTEAQLQPDDQYKLEMAFSRGLYSGWLHGVNHQQLVHGRFGKKRGAFVGAIQRVASDHVEVDLQTPVVAGDGLVFDTGGDPDHEEGGRLWELRGTGLYFERGHIDFAKLKPGNRVWKTSDPQLTRALRKSFTRDIPKPKRRLDITVTGAAAKPLTLTAQIVECGDSSPLCRSQRQSADKSAHSTPELCVHSAIPLQTAYKHPLTKKMLRDQLGRLGETDFVLGEIHNQLIGQVILPVSELNRLRREIVARIVNMPVDPPAPRQVPPPVLSNLLARIPHDPAPARLPELVVLCRTLDQIRVALETGIGTLYVDFEDLRRYPEAVGLARGRAAIFLATPRIQKAGEQGFFKLIEDAAPDGVLIRNLGGLDYFRNSRLRKVGDFSLNVANPLSAELLMREGLERLTVSYDLNGAQVLDLLRAAPPAWFEVVVHQHLPMFHMEHCVFAAFLTNGTDHTNCGRPCDVHNLALRDRVGVEHPVKADVGCRNTVYHAKAQSGAEFLQSFVKAGARVFRVELLTEDASRARAILEAYRELLAGTVADPATLLRRLSVVRQLGVTSGTLTVLG